MENELMVAGGAYPGLTRAEFDGAEKISLDAGGDLVLASKEGEIRFQKPLAYQEVDGARREISASFVLKDTHQVGFQVAAYDTSRPLVIDPVLFYSTYLGGSGTDIGQGVAVDAAGNAYVTGETSSTNLTTTPRALQTTFVGVTDAFLTKLNPTGPGLVSSTYPGGTCSNNVPSIELYASRHA